MHANRIMLIAIAVIVGLLLLTSCSTIKDVIEPAIQTKDVVIPIYSPISAPAELKRIPVPDAELPHFASPTTPGVTSCLVPTQEQKLRKLLDSHEALLDGWEVFGFAK